MRKGILSQFLGLAALGILSGEAMPMASNKPKPVRLEDINGEANKAPIPKGCKEYWFHKNGGFSNGLGNKMRIEDSVYYCIASSDAAAKKKFKKFEENLDKSRE